MSNIYVVGSAMTVFGRHPERSLDDLAGEALQGALKDADCAIGDLGTAFYAGMTNGPLQGQISIPGQVVFSKIGIEGIPVFNVENACASGSSAFHLALQSVKAGSCDVALALGAEKMNIPDKAKAMAIFEAGWDVSRADENFRTLASLGEGVVPPPGSESDRPYSRFMAIYAAMCRNHMKTWGTTQRQIAAVSAKNHQHSVHNPYSQFRKPFSVDEVLAAPPITYPLTLPMCAPLSDGAAAAIVCNEEGLRRIGADRSRAIRVAASVIRSFTRRPVDAPQRSVGHLAALAAYEQAGLGPGRHGRRRGARRVGDGRDHPVRESRLRAVRRRRAGGRARRVHHRRAHPDQSRRAASNPKAIRSARPASARSTSSSPSCAARPVPARSRAPATRSRKTAAASSASKKVPWP